MGVYAVDKGSKASCSACSKPMRGRGGIEVYTQSSGFICSVCMIEWGDNVEKIASTTNFDKATIGHEVVLVNENDASDIFRIEVTRELKTQLHCDLEIDDFAPDNAKKEELVFIKPIHTGQYKISRAGKKYFVKEVTDET